jgi:hypothetical protein
MDLNDCHQIQVLMHHFDLTSFFSQWYWGLNLGLHVC